MVLPAEDVPFQLQRLWGGVEAQLGGQPLAEGRQGPQRRGLVPGGRQRLDQQQLGGFTQRLQDDCLLGRGHGLPGRRRRQGGGSRALQGLQVHARQRPAVILRPVGVGVLGERLTLPVVQRLAEAAQRHRRAVGGQLPASGPHRGGELLGVDQAAPLAGEGVATGDGEDQRWVAQGAPGPAHQHLDVGGRVGRETL
jgi:hypothetical protein